MVWHTEVMCGFLRFVDWDTDVICGFAIADEPKNCGFAICGPSGIGHFLVGGPPEASIK